MARYLKLEVPARRLPPVTLEISSLRNVDGDIVDYYVDEECRAAGKMIKNLALPEGVVIALIVRAEQTILPQGRSLLQSGDHVIVVMRPDVRAMVDRVFAPADHQAQELPPELTAPDVVDRSTEDSSVETNITQTKASDRLRSEPDQ